jgi:hypothetical protein
MMLSFGFGRLRPKLGEREVNSFFGRFLLSVGNVFASLIIGALALAVVWIYVPNVALRLFRWAASVRDWVVLANWPPQYEVALRFFVDERQIVYLGFVLASRIVIGLLIILVAKMMGRKPQPEYPI